MFTVWIQDSTGEIVKQYDDCLGISVISSNEMNLRFPDILEAIGFDSDYVCVVDSQGRHFYPLYIYSVNIG